MFRFNKDTGLYERTGFGKEIEYLKEKGYVFVESLMQMVPESLIK